jgi:hypothetical protein
LVLLFMLSARGVYAQTEDQRAAEKPCRSQPSLVGRCFNVRGRLSLYNGAPTIRLWRAGTRRILGVSSSYAQPGYSSIPEELEKQLGWETELWGNFLVCPFTPPRPKEMQMICIEKASRVVARKRP